MQQFHYTWREPLAQQLDRVRRHLRADVFEILIDAGFVWERVVALDHPLNQAINEAIDNVRVIAVESCAPPESPGRRRPGRAEAAVPLAANYSGSYWRRKGPRT